MEAADDDYWNSMLYLEDGEVSGDAGQRLKDTLERRYRAANSRAIARGFVYSPIEQIVAKDDIGDLLERLKVVAPVDKGRPSRAEDREAEALLGTVEAPPVTVSQAFEIYCNEIAVSDLMHKSPKQKKLWMKTKRRGVQYFIDLIGDKPMTEITRQDGLAFFKWWSSRVMPKDGTKGLQPNTANRDLGNVRLLYSSYFKHIGDEDRPNPFRNLSFKDAHKKTRKNATPPFESDWIRDRILVPELFDDLNEQARLIIYALIETGCRPSEIANLKPKQIHLDAEVPYISIAPTNRMEIKTNSSIREIPLVGISLEAMKRAPKGFPHYYDRNDLLSQALMSAFRNRNLFPTPRHRIYSFRHSFEKRMIEAGIDTELRKLLMGHADERPKYGDGGAMAFRRDELMKIVFQVPDGLF